MGGKVSEEFQAITQLGEDKILYDEEADIGINKEVLDFENRDEYLEQLGVEDITKMKEYSAVELGNNFQLGTRYSDSMKLFYKSDDGSDKPYYMGCYGIGVGRIVATIIENNVIRENGKIKGFSLPVHLAPYKVQIVYKDNKKDMAFKVYENLASRGINAIIDDREDYSLGSKIKDSYVLGTPYVMIIGDKTEGNIVEVEKTKTGEKFNIDINNIEDVLNKN